MFKKIIFTIYKKIRHIYITQILDVDMKKNVSFGKSIIVDKKNGGEFSIGENTYIGDYSIFRTAGNAIHIGHHCSINGFCFFHATGGISIGNYTIIADHVSIHAANHNFMDKNTYIVDQGKSSKGISIGNDVWIGSGVKILDGVTIGDGAVIGAGSVVIHDIEEFSIAVGVPAKTIKKRI